ncbi:hypothetical protein J6590_014651 [Homalodisca vitripennis]|nr:hypothetical protein J6590_014651 [Homalodisca vitripennis]
MHESKKVEGMMSRGDIALAEAIAYKDICILENHRTLIQQLCRYLGEVACKNALYAETTFSLVPEIDDATLKQLKML